MKYFLEQDFEFDEDNNIDFSATPVFFDSSSEESIESNNILEMFDEDNLKYINLDEVDEHKEEYLDYCTSGMESYIKFKLEDGGILYRKWEQAIRNLREDFKDTKIYPFVYEEDFYDALSDRISDAASKMWDSIACDEAYDDSDYEDEEYDEEDYNDEEYDNDDYDNDDYDNDEDYEGSNDGFYDPIER